MWFHLMHSRVWIMFLCFIGIVMDILGEKFHVIMLCSLIIFYYLFLFSIKNASNGGIYIFADFLPLIVSSNMLKIKVSFIWIYEWGWTARPLGPWPTNLYVYNTQISRPPRSSCFVFLTPLNWKLTIFNPLTKVSISLTHFKLIYHFELCLTFKVMTLKV